MKVRFIVVAVAGLGIMSGGLAWAHARHRLPRHCIDQTASFSLWGLLFNPHPQPNGCAPPVFVNGEYVGQDPDPNIRFQLRRDPSSGYAYDLLR